MSHLSLAQHYLEVQKPQKALDELAKLSSSGLEEVTFWILRARAFYDSKDYTNALEAAQAGLKLEPDNLELGYAVHLAQAAMGRFGDSETTIQRILERAPQNFVFLSSYGKLLIKMGELNRADEIIRQAEALAPTNYYVRQARISYDFKRRNYRSVIRQSRQLLEQNPDDVYARTLLSAALKRSFKFKEAEVHANEVAYLRTDEEQLVKYARGLRNLNKPIGPQWFYPSFGYYGIWFGFLMALCVLAQVSSVGALSLFGGYVLLVILSRMLTALKNLARN